MDMVKVDELKKGKYGFLCPKCESFNILLARDSEGNLWLYCNSCGYECKIVA